MSGEGTTQCLQHLPLENVKASLLWPDNDDSFISNMNRLDSADWMNGKAMAGKDAEKN